MKYNFHKISILFIFLFLPLSIIQAQFDIGKPFIQNYTFRDYNAAAQNWWAIEDDRGIMYFANGTGVLEFDGENWTLMQSEWLRETRSIAKDKEGTLYVAMGQDLGYLKPNEKGEMQFVSLKDKLPEEDQTFNIIWEVDYWNDAIYYRSSEKLFKWDGESFKTITAGGNYHVGKVINDRYLIRIWDVGLCEMQKDDSIVLLPGGEYFADQRIYVMLPYDEENILLGSRDEGKFYLYDGQNLTHFKTEIDDVISEGGLYLPGIVLPNGNFAFNTFSIGVFVIDKNGKLVQTIDRESGLTDNSITYLYIDSRGILWLTSFNGISSIDLNSSFTYVDESVGLPTVVYEVIQHKGMLYAGSNNGVHYYNESTKKFEQIPGTFGQTSFGGIHRGRLYYASGGMGIIELVGKSFKYVRKSQNYDFRVTQILMSKTDPDRMYAHMQEGGITALYFDESRQVFVEESRTTLVDPDYGAFTEDTLGHIWCKGLEDGTLARVEPFIENGKLDFSRSNIVIYDSTHGLPSTPIGFWEIDGIFDIISGGAFYGYDKENQRFVQKEAFYEELFEPNAISFPDPVMDKLGRTWFGAGRGIITSQTTSEGVRGLNYSPFKEIQNRPVWSITIDDRSTEENTIAWIAGIDGITRYEGNLEAPPEQDFKVLIRNISISGDSVIYGGEGEIPEKLEISSGDNNVSVTYASPFYLSIDQLKYQTILEGQENEWSEWVKEPIKRFTNLPSGNYTFKVRAKNIYDNTTEPATFSFRILPPWYASWWAYALYLLTGAGLIYGIVNLRTRNLKRKQAALEEKVKERTEEVQQRVDELATVNRVSQALTENLEFNALVNMVGDKMKNLFHANIAYLAIHDKATNMINFPYQDGDTMQPIKYGEGFTSKIINTGKPLLVNSDISKQYNKLGLDQVGKNASSYLGVPIPVEGEIIGVLSVQSTEHENRFDENDQRLLGTIATHVGIALHNAELYDEAREARAQAENANEAKSAFLSTVSHELRTPLTSVLGFAKIIKKRLEDRIFPVIQTDDAKIQKTMGQVSENLNVVISEGERLTQLINDVLDLAKIEAGKIEWNMEIVSIPEIIERAVSATSSLFDKKNLPLNKEIANDLPELTGDKNKLIQVVINLLSNAIKFTDEGEVICRTYQENNDVIISIKDSGIGISPEDQKLVFDKFKQVGDTLTDKPQGTGLGLPICKEIVEHHGGRIWVESITGEGSTFFFSLPVKIEKDDSRPVQLNDLVLQLKNQIQYAPLEENGAEKTILVVDDDSPIRSLLRQELGEIGYKIREAENGKAALESVREQKPDLIILDVMMPEMNGFDVAAVLKNDPGTMDIPIIILSIVEDKQRGFRIGVDRYMTKPINTEKLFSEVSGLLHQKKSKKKVLVVDEDASAVKTLSDVLQARGYIVEESNGGELMEKAKTSKPDIIILNSLLENQDIVKTLRFEKGLENVLFLVYQ